MPATRVLFVCLGNSCRSPMAEALARHLGSEVIEASSAGLMALGYIAAPTQAVLDENGIASQDLVSKPCGRSTFLPSTWSSISPGGRSKNTWTAGHCRWKIGRSAIRSAPIWRSIGGFEMRSSGAWWTSLNVCAGAKGPPAGPNKAAEEIVCHGKPLAHRARIT